MITWISTVLKKKKNQFKKRFIWSKKKHDPIINANHVSVSLPVNWDQIKIPFTDDVLWSVKNLQRIFISKLALYIAVDQ